MWREVVSVAVDPGGEVTSRPAEYPSGHGVVDDEPVRTGNFGGVDEDVAQPVGQPGGTQSGPQGCRVDTDVLDAIAEYAGECVRDVVVGHRVGPADVPGLTGVCRIGQRRDGEVGDVLRVDDGEPRLPHDGVKPAGSHSGRVPAQE